MEINNLNYEYNALEPSIGKDTVYIHYEKHHKTYLQNLNNLIKNTEFENESLENIIKKSSEGPIFNNAAQVWNHSFYWEEISPSPQNTPSGKLLKLINEEWGNFEKFKVTFSEIAVKIFGSGWAWLVLTNNKLDIITTSNANTPIAKDYSKPLLTCDVWEHAYYLDYQNKRIEYINNFWKVVDWKIIEERLEK